MPARSPSNRNANRRMLYRYARSLGMSSEAARDAQKSATWLVEQFPEHRFPDEILELRGRGSYARKMAYLRRGA